ncbi:MAG: trypsin-like serine protease, partial [Limnohabitans sp.]
MVATVTSYTDLRNRAATGMGLDGVVRVSAGGHYGTGALLFDGRAVLTAAHLFSSGSTSGSVFFETVQGRQSITFSKLVVHPGYDTSSNKDLALLWLSASAPIGADRYQPYRQTNEIGQSYTLVGYGNPGTGAAGVYSGEWAEPIRQQASNVFDADMARLKQVYGSALGWTPLAGSQLVADFDNGLAAQDALGQFLGLRELGQAQTEGLLTPGDSGGPALMAGQLAGVASYSASLSLGGKSPDIDETGNSTFGEIAAWQRVSFFQQWIDQSLRAAYPNAPARPQDVQKQVAEGQSGTTYAYFLV